uniref:Uncharacterized protein n=1 Tax=Manihot esculenta TaxID=3983 RepID=A0A2C9W8I6_MANES
MQFPGAREIPFSTFDYTCVIYRANLPFMNLFINKFGQKVLLNS